MNENNIEDALAELFVKCKERYGDEIERFWFYGGENCPCCNKRKIDALTMGKDLAISLNAFMYWDMNTLIGYLLCSCCITDLLRSDNSQKKMYGNLEQNLKDAFHDHLKSSAS